LRAELERWEFSTTWRIGLEENPKKEEFEAEELEEGRENGKDEGNERSDSKTQPTVLELALKELSSLEPGADPNSPSTKLVDFLSWSGGEGRSGGGETGFTKISLSEIILVTTASSSPVSLLKWSRFSCSQSIFSFFDTTAIQ